MKVMNLFSNKFISKFYSTHYKAIPNCLNDIAKIQLLRKQPKNIIHDIWTKRFENSNYIVANCWNEAEFNIFQKRAITCPQFILPIIPYGYLHRNSCCEDLFIEFQNQGKFCLIGKLNDFRSGFNTNTTMPLAVIHFFSDLQDSHQIVLIYGGVIDSNYLNKNHLSYIQRFLKLFYLDYDKFANFPLTFNKKTKNFMYNDYIRKLRSLEPTLVNSFIDV